MGCPESDGLHGEGIPVLLAPPSTLVELIIETSH